MKVHLQIACFNPESAAHALRAGADSVEISEDFFVGGKTPSDKMIEKYSAEAGELEKHVMIHKLGSSYVYTKRDFEWMMDRMGDINEKLNADGFFFAATTDQNTLDLDKLKELVTAAEGKICTFHRAFDQLSNKEEALKQLVQLGFKRVITAGGDGNAIHNLETLSSLVKFAQGRIEIFAAGGIRSHNVKQILATGVAGIHTSAIVRGEISDESEIRKIKEALA